MWILFLNKVDQLTRIYDLYSQFKEFQVNMSSMLWGDLDITLLQKGADDLEKSSKKFPKELKEVYTFKMVEAKLVNFKEALPLVVNLKNDAMKTRLVMQFLNNILSTYDLYY